MKKSAPSAGDSSPTPLSRRTLFAGATTVGALAAVASVLPRGPAPQAVADTPAPKPARGGGYTLSEHVQHYYKTARL